MLSTGFDMLEKNNFFIIFFKIRIKKVEVIFQGDFNEYWGCYISNDSI